MNEPLELKNKEVTVKNLSKLDYIELDDMGNNEYIVKKKLTGNLAGLKRFLSFNWIGQILKDKINKKYYFCNELGNLKDVFKLEDWNKIKEFMEALA